MLTSPATLTEPRRRRSVPAIGQTRIGRGRRIVALGGGTGLPVLLRGLKEAMFAGEISRRYEKEQDRLTAIVTMADDGGSSGRLRDAYGVLAPGDLRNCLLALSGGDPRLASLFDFRFRGEGELGGHNLGNLILTAMSQLEDDLLGAIAWASSVLAVHGRVLPASLEPLTLRADYEDGTCMDGESRIAAAPKRIERLSIRPAGARALPQALRAIHGADLIVIGPGSLYTSILPILLIHDIALAIEHSMARVLLVLNLMTEPGETDGYSAADFVLALQRHAPRLRIRDVLINNAPVGGPALARHEAKGGRPVAVDPDSLRFLSCAPVLRDQLEEGAHVRHDSRKLAHAVLELADEEVRCAIQS
jgi:uncharacterized cofD-like protein